MATAPTYAQLIAKWPALADAAQQTAIESWLSYTTTQVSDLAFPDADEAHEARLALGAHLWVMDTRSRKHGGDGVGAVTSRTNENGDLVTYTAPRGSMTDSALLTTPYGVLFVQLRRASVEACSIFSM